MRTWRMAVTTAGLLGALTGGCGTGSTPVHVVALTDSESAAVLSSINSGEITVAQSVKARLADPQAQSFAQQMISEHTTLNMTAMEVLAQKNLAPRLNAVSEQVDTSAQQAVSQLSGLSGPPLDVAYLNNQVTVHQQALTLIDCVVRPSVQDPSLLSFVSNTERPVVVAHLLTATSLATALQSGGAQASVGSADGGIGVQCTNVCDAQSDGGPLPDPLRISVCR